MVNDGISKRESFNSIHSNPDFESKNTTKAHTPGKTSDGHTVKKLIEKFESKVANETLNLKKSEGKVPIKGNENEIPAKETAKKADSLSKNILPTPSVEEKLPEGLDDLIAYLEATQKAILDEETELTLTSEPTSIEEVFAPLDVKVKELNELIAKSKAKEPAPEIIKKEIESKKAQITKQAPKENEKITENCLKCENVLNKLKELENDPTLKLVIKEGKIDLAQKNLLDKFLDKFFSTKRSQRAQEKIAAILENLLAEIDFSNSKQSTYKVKTPDGFTQKNISLLRKELLETSYAQQAIQHSPFFASRVATPMLAKISKDFGTPDSKNFNLLRIESQFFININKSFKEYLEATPYDGQRMLKFIRDLPHEAALANISEIKFDQKDSEAKALKILDEVLATESTFIAKVSELKQNNLVSNQKDLTIDLDNIIIQGNILIDSLKKIVENENTATSEKIKAYHQIFLSHKISPYLKTLTDIIPKIPAMTQKLSLITASTGDKSEFELNIRTVKDITHRIRSRITQHDLLMKEMNKLIPLSESYYKIFDYNLTSLQSEIKLIDAKLS